MILFINIGYFTEKRRIYTFQQKKHEISKDKQNELRDITF